MRGKKPTLKQKKAIKFAGLNYNNWLVIENDGYYIQIRHRETGTVKSIPL